MKQNWKHGAVTTLAAAGLLLQSGCSEPAPKQEPIDAAQQVLTAFLDDDTPFAGFRIGESDITVIAGDPLREHILYDKDGNTPPAGDEEKYPPPHIPSGRFPLSESLERARTHVEQCDGEASAEVKALSEQAVVTSLRCEQDGEEPERVVMLNDDVLPRPQDPLSRESLAQFLEQIEAAGLKDIRMLTVYREQRTRSVFFGGPHKYYVYEWNQNLEKGTTLVERTSYLTRSTFSLDEYPAERILEAFDEAMSQASDPSLVRAMRVTLRKGEVLLVVDGAEIVPHRVEVVVEKGA